MKKLLISLICSLSVLTLIPNIKAEEKQSQKGEVVNVYIFTKEGCGYCERAATYFSELSADKEYGEMFNVITLKVYDSNWNIVNQEFYDTLMKLTKKMGDTFGGTPYIIVGEKSFNGFSTDFDADIKKEIKRCYEKGYKDPLANVDSKENPIDPDKGMKLFINIITLAIAGVVVAALVISRLPKKKEEKSPEVIDKKDQKKQIKKPKDEKENIKHTPKSERVEHNAPKAKSSGNKKTKQKK